MKKQFTLIVLSLFLFIGCATNYEQIRMENREKINKLSYNSSKQDVLKVMGTKTSGEITNPYRTAMYKHKDKIIEILFYYTDKKKSDGAITDDELTPIVIIDNKVDGWGWMYWDSLVKKYELRVR